MPRNRAHIADRDPNFEKNLEVRKVFFGSITIRRGACSATCRRPDVERKPSVRRLRRGRDRTWIDAPTGIEKTKVQEERCAFFQAFVAKQLDDTKPSSTSGDELSTAVGFNDPGGKGRRSGAAGAIPGAA